METINTIELSDPDRYPDDDLLAAVLGDAFAAYRALLALLDRHGLIYEWRYYRDGKAWLCKVQHRKRTIVWMSAWRGYMQATIYFPAKHTDAVFALSLGADTIARFRTTKSVGRSMPCIFEVHNAAVLADFERVMELKLRAT